jgi:hypothetical protein
LSLIASACHAQAGADISGIWASEQVIPPSIHGALIIDGQKSEWRATISKLSTPVGRALPVQFGVDQAFGDL